MNIYNYEEMEVFLQSLPIERLCGFPFPPETDTSTPPPPDSDKTDGQCNCVTSNRCDMGGGVMQCGRKTALL
jgi:hypothetical protein